MKTNIQHLITAIIPTIMLLLAVLFSGCNDKKEEAKDQTSKPATEVNGKSQQTITDSKDAADAAVPADTLATEEAEEAPSQLASETPKERNQLHPVYMGVWGVVGGTGVNFDMDGTTGSYIPYDIAEAKEYGARRQLKLVSYDPKSGSCVINAYLNGKYIGQFDGIFEEYEGKTDDGGDYFMQAYNGIFKSVKGDKLKFNFHFD